LGQGECFEIPTWECIYSLLLDLARSIHISNFVPDTIVGISRGGWIPARVLSDLLSIHDIASVKAEFYLGVNETASEPVITQPVSANVADKSVLVVDDVADTGKSLRLVKAHLLQRGAKELKIATLYYKPWSVILPDFYEKRTRDWIIFPWERKEALKKVIERARKLNQPIAGVKETLIRSGYSAELVERFLPEIHEE
jgi:hypoxanthine phosphoribosyltransferase